MAVALEGESHILESRIRLKYKWWIGRSGCKFYEEIRNRKKICGLKCLSCEVVYVPPKENCPKCFSKMHEWVELGDTGELITYTVVNYSLPVIQPKKPPFVLGIVKLEGADTGLIHFIDEVKIEEIKIGMHVQAVFNKNPKGNYLDIEYFKPI
jgi:uncharacterized OB-fold protein